MLHRESSTRITGWSQFEPIVGSACAMQTVRMARCVQYWNETQASLQGNARIVPEVIWNYSSARKLICQVWDFKTLHVDFFVCVCVCLSTWPLFFCQSFSHANIHSWWKTGKITKPLGWKMDITQRMAGVSRCLSRWFAQNPQFYNITWNIVKGIGPLHERVRLGPDTI